MPTQVTQEFFIKPGANLQSGSQDYVLMGQLSKQQIQLRWQTSEGRNILARWKAEKYQRADDRGLTSINKSPTDRRSSGIYF